MKKITQSERGQSFVELGVSMVFLLVLLAGVIDLGRAIFTYIAIRDAVQEGASYAIINPTDCSGINNRIRSHTSGAIDLSDTGMLIDVKVDGVACASAPPASICPGDPVEVEITVQKFQIAAPFIGTILGTQTVSFGAEVVDSVIINPSLPSGCP